MSGSLISARDLHPLLHAARQLVRDLCKKLPNMRRYAVNLLEPERFPNFPYDGFSELWFDSEEALRASLDSPEGRNLLADLPNFVEKIEPLLVIEHPMV